MSDTLLYAQFKKFDEGREHQIYLIRDLFGQLSLVQYHGGQRKIRVFDDLNEAWRETQRAAKVRLKNHYTLIAWKSSTMPIPDFISAELKDGVLM